MKILQLYAADIGLRAYTEFRRLHAGIKEMVKGLYIVIPLCLREPSDIGCDDLRRYVLGVDHTSQIKLIYYVAECVPLYLCDDLGG